VPRSCHSGGEGDLEEERIDAKGPDQDCETNGG
jgi:hypothetical protein